MKIAAAALAVLCSAAAHAAPAPKIASESAMLSVTAVVSAPGGGISTKTLVQAQSQFNAKVEVPGKQHRTFSFSAVPVINPNNGKVRAEYKASAQWLASGESFESMSAFEVELGREVVLHDAEGVTLRVKIVLAE
jgi:hypothetical protein